MTMESLGLANNNMWLREMDFGNKDETRLEIFRDKRIRNNTYSALDNEDECMK